MIFTSGSTGTPEGRRGHATAPPRRSSTPSRGCSSRRRRSAAGDRVMAGLSVAFDASCEEMWLAWAHGACLVPAPRSLVRSGVDVGPWLVANDDHRRLHRPDARRRCGRPRRWTGVRLLILGGEACPPEIGERLARAGPGGLEHLRTDRGNRGGLRRPPGRTTARCASGCRWTAGTSRSSTTRGGPVPDGEVGELIVGGRRARPLPRPGQGRREVRRRCRRSAGSGPTAPGTGSASTEPVCCSRAAPTTRSSSAAGASSSARSTARCCRCQASSALRPPCVAAGPATSCWSGTSPSTTASTRARPRSCSGTRCRRRWCRASPRSADAADPDLRERSTGTPCRGRCRPPQTPADESAGAVRHRRAGSPSCGSTCSVPWSAAPPTTSSTSAAEA